MIVETDQRVQALEDQLWRSWRRLVPSGRGVLLAVSGGPDSMTLLSASARLAGRLGLQFEAATVDHGLRAGSDDEARRVGQRAAALGVTHHVLRAAVSNGPGVEAAARASRYAALEALRVERGLAAIATAHTASDQAETVLMRLVRGSALGGAAAIHAVRADRVVRPLLFATRADVEAWIAARGLEVERDPMNDDPRFLRVKVRQQAIPLLEGLAPRATQALARFAGYAAEDDAWLTLEADHALTRVRWDEGTLEVEGVLSLGRPIARRVIAAWLGGQGVELDGELIDEVLAAVRAGRLAPLPGDRLVGCKNGRVGVWAAPPRTGLQTTSP